MTFRERAKAYIEAQRRATLPFGDGYVRKLVKAFAEISRLAESNQYEILRAHTKQLVEAIDLLLKEQQSPVRDLTMIRQHRLAVQRELRVLKRALKED